MTESSHVVARRIAQRRPHIASRTLAWGGPWIAMSIRWRLTLWFTLIVAVVLTAFSLIAYWYLGTSWTVDTHMQSVARSLQVQDVMRRQERIHLTYRDDNLVALESRYVNLETSLDPFRNPGVMVRAFDAYGTPVGGSAVFADDPERLPLDRAALLTALKGGEHAEVVNTSFGPFYIYTRPAVSQDRRLIGAVQIMTSRNPYEATMHQLGRIFGVATLLATGLSLAMGAAMAQAALAPIDAITRTASRINKRQDLARRIPIEGPRDEVGRLAETVNEMLDRIEAMFERQRQFLADASHELRTPLTTLRGEIDLMSRAQRLDAEGLEAMSMETDRMARLVNDLLLLARADTGLEMRVGRVALDEVMGEVARQGRTLARDTHAVALTAVEPVVLQGDRDRLKQLVLILVDNAITHSPSGTTVSMGLSSDGEGGAVILVSDNGPGIPTEDLERVFDRFYRVDKARSRASGGTGLGLSIARWIVSAHGGEILLDSAPGEGTSFTISLPANGVDQ